jgi:hypothetical protein
LIYTKENLTATQWPYYYSNVDAQACKVTLLEGFKRLTSALSEAEGTASCYIYGERVPPVHSWFGCDGQEENLLQRCKPHHQLNNVCF